MGTRFRLNPQAKRDWKVKIHACEMWVERIEPDAALTTWQARHRILRAMGRAFLIPNRLAGRRWVPKWHPDGDRTKRLTGSRYYFHPKAILIVGSRTHVITVLPCTQDDLATVLIWTITGLWLD
jgi:hypothetical protein